MQLHLQHPKFPVKLHLLVKDRAQQAEAAAVVLWLVGTALFIYLLLVLLGSSGFRLTYSSYIYTDEQYCITVRVSA